MSTTPTTINKTPMQKLRENPEYKLKEDRIRLISRISKGATPRQSTLKKYNLTIDDVNKIRNENGLKKMKIPSHQDIINKTTDIDYQDDNWKEVASAANDKEQITTQNNYKFLDEKHIFSLKNAKHFLTHHPGVVKRSGQINDTERAKTTVTKNVDALDRLFTKVLKNVDLNNIIKNLSIANIMNSLDNYKYRSKPIGTTAKITYLIALSIYLKEYPAVDVENPPWNRFYIELDEVIQSKLKLAKSETIDKSTKQKVTPFSDIVEAFKTTFGEDSEEYLYIKIYSEAPTRDDMHNLKVFYEELTNDVKQKIESKNKGNNCIFIHKSIVHFALIKFKTDQGYKPSYIKFSSNLSKMIINYLRKLTSEKRKQLQNTLFGTKKMTTVVGKWLKQSGIKLDKTDKNFNDNVNVGNINLLRHSFVTEQLSKPGITIEERSKLADAMKHSPNVSLAYVRDTLKK